MNCAAVALPGAFSSSFIARDWLVDGSARSLTVSARAYRDCKKEWVGSLQAFYDGLPC